MRRVLLLLVLAVLLSLAPPPLTRRHEGKDEKRFTLAVNGKTWPEVFTWLSDATSKPVISVCRPAGTCNVTTPLDRRCTLNEVIDLFNEELLGNNQPVPCYILPRDRNITVVPWEGAPEERAMRIGIDDLPHFPRTVPVIVWIVLPLKTLCAGDLVAQVRKMMGPDGDVAALEGANQLVMQDQVRNVERIVKFIRNLDSPKKP
jgi:hypothetical protein